jgi:hypothetical protein
MQQYWGMWSDIALVLFGMAALVLAVGSVWLRAKRLLTDESGHAEGVSLERLDRIEQIVETSAIEIERIAEGQRYVSKLLAERPPMTAPGERNPGRIVTPHPT